MVRQVQDVGGGPVLGDLHLRGRPSGERLGLKPDLGYWGQVGGVIKNQIAGIRIHHIQLPPGHFAFTQGHPHGDAGGNERHRGLGLERRPVRGVYDADVQAGLVGCEGQCLEFICIRGCLK